MSKFIELFTFTLVVVLFVTMLATLSYLTKEAASYTYIPRVED